MTSPWGKIILGALAAVAAWRSLTPDQQQGLLKFIDGLAVETQRRNLEQEQQQQQQLAFSPKPQLEPPDPGPLSLEIVRAFNQHFPTCISPASAPSTNSPPTIRVEPK